jgi:hypothetical protein
VVPEKLLETISPSPPFPPVVDVVLSGQRQAICAAPVLPVAPLPVWVPAKWFDVGVPPFTPAAPFPAWKVVRKILTLPDPVTHPAMLELPFPFASVPVALGDVNVMSSTTTAPLTALTISAGPPLAGETFAVVPAEYCQFPPAQVSPP